MTLPIELVDFITALPGSLVYHLVTLFAIQLILAVSFGHWYRHRHNPAAMRMLIMGGVLFLTRLALMFVAALGFVGVLKPSIVLPPLERLLDFAMLPLVAWTFLPIAERNQRLSTLILVAVLLTAVIVYAGFAILWPTAEASGLSYNSFWQGNVWEISALAFLIFTLTVTLLWRTFDWGLLTCLFGLWLVGHAAQLAFSLLGPVVESDIAGWVRLTNLAALPLLSSLVYRRALQALSIAADEDTTLGVVGVLKAARRIESGHDVEAALGLAASSIARALGADMVAVGVPVSEKNEAEQPSLSQDVEEISIAALSPPTSAVFASQEPRLHISHHPALAEAVWNKRTESVTDSKEITDLADLYRGLGFEQPGPLLMHPLHEGDYLLGLVLIGTPISRRPWSARDGQIARAMSAPILDALLEVQRREQALESEATEAELGAKLKRAIWEARRLAQKVASLESELEHQRERCDELSTKLRLREKEIAEQKTRTPESDIIWQEEIRELSDAREALQKELAEWKARTEQIARAKADLEEQLERTQRTGAGQMAAPQDTAYDEVIPSLLRELRAPMKAIVDVTDTLLEETPKDMEDDVLRIKANIERLGRILGDLVQVITVETERASLAPEPVNVTTLIGEMAMTLTDLCSANDVTLQINLPSDLPPARVDKSSSRRILRQLLSNACRCSQPGTDVTVTAHLEEHEEQLVEKPAYVLVSVTDTGGGIAPEDQPRVFRRPLWDAGDDGDKAHPIAGLADGTDMALVKALVEANQGRIWVESETGAGSTFNFILPIYD